jgi:hypothetical protein
MPEEVSLAKENTVPLVAAATLYFNITVAILCVGG